MAHRTFKQRCAENDLIQRWAAPAAVKKINGWLTVFWLANFPPVLYLYLTVSTATFQNICLLYLALVSIWANVAGHFSAWVAGRVEVRQEDAL